MTRDERQNLSIYKIQEKNYNCLYIAATGFGKTIVGIKSAINCLSKNPHKLEYDLTVVVPTIRLKKQWESILEDYTFKSQVFVINGKVLNDVEINNSLITIFDECHVYINGEIFNKIFDLSKTKFKIALTATITPEQIDKISSFLPVADIVSKNECIKNDWISKFIEYNLFVELNDENRLIYDKESEIFENNFIHFNKDLQSMIRCSNFFFAKKYVIENNISLVDKNNNKLNFEETVKNIVKIANITRNSLKKRNDLLESSINKVEAVKELLAYLKNDYKIITFGKLTESCDKLENETFGLAYHSNLKSKNIFEKELIKYDLKKENKKIDSDKIVLCSKKKLQELIIKKFNNNETTCLHTVKSLDLGIDIKGVNCCIFYHFDNNKEKKEQKNGRALRVESEDKLSLLINVALSKTKDEHWLKRSQYNTNKFKISVYSTNELLEDLKERRLN